MLLCMFGSEGRLRATFWFVLGSSPRTVRCHTGCTLKYKMGRRRVVDAALELWLGAIYACVLSSEGAGCTLRVARRGGWVFSTGLQRRVQT